MIGELCAQSVELIKTENRFQLDIVAKPILKWSLHPPVVKL